MFISTYEFSDYERYLLEVKNRVKLNKYDRRKLSNFEMGYAGELMFYNEVKSLGGVKLWNTRFETAGEVQYDFLIINDGYLLHFDIKNFYGNYHVVDNNFVKDDGNVIKDPIDQLLRADIILKNFCKANRLNYRVESFIIFINEHFKLSGFGGHRRVLFHRDLERVTSSLIHQPSPGAIRDAELLKSYSVTDTNERIHYYDYHTMRKGIKCPKCKQFLRKFEKFEKKIACTCGYKVSKAEAVRIAFDTITILKNSSVKCVEVMEYTGIGRSTVQRVLKAYSEKQGSTKSRVYVINKSNDLFVKESFLKYEVNENPLRKYQNKR